MPSPTATTKPANFKRKEFDFSSYGAFFCFNKKQFDEKKKEKVKYANMGGGLVVPVEHSKTIWGAFKEHHKRETQRELEVRGKRKMIIYHLANYECFYTGDFEEALPVLLTAGITKEEILKVYQEEKNNYTDF